MTFRVIPGTSAPTETGPAPQPAKATAPEARMVGTPEARMVGTPEARMVGTPEARMVGTPEARVVSAPVARTISVRPGPLVPALRVPVAEGSALAPLVERLETLAATLENVNQGSRNYAAEAVMETLARMERRDLQSLAAVEAFAAALKTVGQHLAGLRHVVQGVAQDQHTALDLVDQRLMSLETRLGVTVPAEATGGIGAVLDRLERIETAMTPPVAGLDAGPVVRLLETVAHRVLAVEDKIDALPAQIQPPAVDLAPLSGQLEHIAAQVGRVEEHVVHAQASGSARILAAVEEIARRVAHIELQIDQAPGQLPPEPFDSTPILDTLQEVARRVATIEARPAASGTDLAQLSSLLERIGTRLDKMEAGMAMPSPVRAIHDDSERPSRRLDPYGNLAAAPAVVSRPPPPASVAAPVPVVPPVAPETEHGQPAPAPVEGEDAAQARQRVDMLLEQVFRVLSR